MEDTVEEIKSVEIKLKGSETDPKDKRIVCEVCGHSNPAENALCEMCSNYLFEQSRNINLNRGDKTNGK